MVIIKHHRVHGELPRLLCCMPQCQPLSLTRNMIISCGVHHTACAQSTHTFVYFYRHVSPHFLHSSHNPRKKKMKEREEKINYKILRFFFLFSRLQVYVFISSLRLLPYTHCVFTYRMGDDSRKKNYFRLLLTHWIKISICFNEWRKNVGFWLLNNAMEWN